MDIRNQIFIQKLFICLLLQTICMMKCTYFQGRPELSIQALSANKHLTLNTELSIYVQHQLDISAENPWLPTLWRKILTY